MQTASKSVQFLAVVAIVSACIVNTDAVAFRDVDSFVVNGKGQIVNSSTAANGVFSIVSPSEGNSITIGAGYGSESGKTYSDIAGFRPGYDVAYNASAFFYIRDDYDATKAPEIVNVKLDGLRFDSETSYTTTSIVGGNLWLANAVLLIALNIDGTLKYSVTSGNGSDFYLEYARLEVDAWQWLPTTGGTTGGGTNVPDGGATVMLFGVGLLGLFATQRLRK
ncbi:MAG TPA: VPDSG-CTERM sorting domain-containing protein [Verrucomicrobiae bacterium]